MVCLALTTPVAKTCDAGGGALRSERRGLRDVPFSVPELDDLRNRVGVFKDASKIASVNLTGAGRFEKVS
jgi:hypothetical protein